MNAASKPVGQKTFQFRHVCGKHKRHRFAAVYLPALDDAVGNTRTLSTADIEALGFPTEIYVIDPATRPTVTAISPSSGGQGTAVAATIMGSNLSGATAVRFGGSGVTATIGNGGTAASLPITITVAPGAETGARTVAVVTTTGGISTAFSEFTVTPPTPTLASVTP